MLTQRMRWSAIGGMAWRLTGCLLVMLFTTNPEPGLTKERPARPPKENLLPRQVAAAGACQGNTTREFGEFCKKIGKIVGRLEGRVRATFVYEGMTLEQVGHVLGGGDLSAGPATVMVGGLVFVLDWPFYRLGLSVGFRIDEKGVFRVTHIRRWSLLD